MLKEKFIFTVCIISIFVSGVYATLIFQGAGWGVILSSLANLATVMGFLLGLYVFNVWKSQGRREFTHSHLMDLLKQSHMAQGNFVLLIYYGMKSEEIRFYESMQSILDFSDNLEMFIKICEYNSKLCVDDRYIEITKFREYVVHLKSLTVAEREVSDKNKSDLEVLYFVLSNPSVCSSYLRGLNGYMRKTIICFPQVRVELESIGIAL
tara:strand:+ start:137 stop:763 length:627 start_codon:yes stop_codon:yes gene_type:complete